MTLLAVAAIIHFLVPLMVLPPLRLAAALVGTTGFLVMLRAWWLFRAAGTPICPTDRATTLITGDVFALTRNPMYLGMVMMVLAIALFSGALSFYAAALVLFLVFDLVFCPFEERRLDSAFVDFDAYSSRVRRWI